MSQFVENVISNTNINKEVLFHDNTINSYNITTTINNDSESDGEYTFGIFKLLATGNICQKNKLIIFSIDRSGSMDDKCYDKRTKMQHTIHTLSNIVRFFEKNNYQINIIINVFDNEVETIIENTVVDSQTLNLIIEKIEKIHPNASTNFEKPLNIVKEQIEKFGTHLNIDRNNIYHIFMTDGEVNDGSSNKIDLIPLLDTNIHNIFIGFGIEHNSDLLYSLSNYRKGNYYFVDILENAGIVYGEITHEIVNTCFNDIEIKINNGLIYDWKNNVWSDILYINNIILDKSLIFQIKTLNRENLSVALSCEMDTNTSTTINHELCDLTKYIFRQKTQEILYKVNSTNFRKDKSITRKDLKKFYDLIKNYMTENNCVNDPLLKLLLDDIYIVFRTLNKSRSQMYTRARQTSQGRQQIYTVNNNNNNNNTTINNNTIGSNDTTVVGNGYSTFVHFTTPNRLLRSRNKKVEDEDDFDILDFNVNYPEFNLGRRYSVFDGVENDMLPHIEPRSNTPYSFNELDPFTNEYDEDYLEHTFSQYDCSPFISPSCLNTIHSVSVSMEEMTEQTECDGNETVIVNELSDTGTDTNSE